MVRSGALFDAGDRCGARLRRATRCRHERLLTPRLEAGRSCVPHKVPYSVEWSWCYPRQRGGPDPTLRLVRPVARTDCGIPFPSSQDTEGRGERLHHLMLNKHLSLANLPQRPWVIPAPAWPAWTSCGLLKRLGAASGFCARRRDFPFPSTGRSSPAV